MTPNQTEIQLDGSKFRVWLEWSDSPNGHDAC